jgi:hypothetical protein
MDRTKVVLTMAGIWLGAALVCQVLSFIPKAESDTKGDSGTDYRQLLIKQPAETFGPQLGIILAFIFAAPHIAFRRQKDGVNGPTQDWLAVALTVAYCAAGLFLMAQCAMGGTSMKAAVENSTSVRPFMGTLVAAMIPVYFTR